MKQPNYKGRRSLEEDYSWSVSYVDVLSLLLCFSVIFFQVKDNDRFHKVLAEVNAGLKLNDKSKGTGTGSGTGTGTGTGMGTGVGTATGQMKDVSQHLAKIPGIESWAKMDFKSQELIIQFPAKEFFKSGSHTLNKEGKELLSKVMTELLAWKGQVVIKIKGHTDSRNISKAKLKFSDNWELSVLRSVSGLKLFLQAGFPSSDLIAEGVADNDQLNNSGDNEQRRLTLIVSPRTK